MKKTNKLIKYPFGGTANTPEEEAAMQQYQRGNVQSSLTQPNPQIDQAASAVPVYGQVYGLAKGGSNLGKSLIKTDTYGNPINPQGKVANDWLTPDHELIMNGYKH